jgi:hypothetical protein
MQIAVRGRSARPDAALHPLLVVAVVSSSAVQIQAVVPDFMPR